MNLWLLLVLMSLATYRGTRLVVDDTFPPVLWVRDRVVGGWRPLTLKEQHLYTVFPMDEGEQIEHLGDLGTLTKTDGQINRYIHRSERVPMFFAGLMSCPYCASGWIAAGVTVGVWWWLSLAVPLLVLLWLGAWALGGLVAAQDWS